MKYNYFNIYNNLIKLTRNKNLYLNLEKDDTFYERLIFFFFHLALFLKNYKSSIPSKNLQELFDYIIRQIELSIRETGYGDASVNKKMKEYVNLFYSVLDKIETSDLENDDNLVAIFREYININKNIDFYASYLKKYRLFLSKTSLNNFTKDIINLNF